MSRYAFRCCILFTLSVVLFRYGSSLDKRKLVRHRGTALAGVPAATLANANKVAEWCEDNGLADNNPASGTAGVTFPRGTATAVFSSGLIWGGRVHDGGSQILRVNGQTYITGTAPGRIVSKGVAENPANADVRMYRVRADYATADLTQDAAEFFNKTPQTATQSEIDSVRNQYATDWAEWPWQKGAPFYDSNGNGVKDSAESPGIANATQVVWFVTNDLDSAQSASFLGSDPIGLEVQATFWAYNDSGPVGNVIFKKYRFIYKGTSSTDSNATIDSMYVGQWSDPDLGDLTDDYAGCDTALGLGFVYNASPVDPVYQSYGLPPPSVGYDLLEGPLVASPGDTAFFNLHRVPGYKNLPMTSWIYFAAGGIYSDPPYSYEGAGQWFYLLQGLTPVDGSPFVFPGGTAPTKFWLSGDPVAGTGRLDGTIDSAGDRQMMLSSGPFTMALGDTQEIVTALVGGAGGDRLASISAIRANVQAAKTAYRNLIPPIIAGVHEGRTGLPGAYSLGQNYPNPFNPVTRISYTLPHAGQVKLAVYDLLGREIRTLVNGVEAAGTKSAQFEAGNLPSGVYFYRLEAGIFGGVKKMLLMR